MRYNMMAKVYNVVFGKLATKYYKDHFPDVDFAPLKKQIKKEYRAMVERTPGIGGTKKNSLESNLVGACYFFSMAKVIPGFTPDLLDDMVLECMHSPLMVKMHSGKKKKGTMFSEKVHEQKRREAKESQTQNYEMGWKYDYRGNSQEFFYNYTKCGVCRLAERENLKDFLPCMCRMDYPKFEIQGGKLIRTKTLANGDECCDFHVIRIKED